MAASKVGSSNLLILIFKSRSFRYAIVDGKEIFPLNEQQVVEQCATIKEKGLKNVSSEATHGSLECLSRRFGMACCVPTVLQSSIRECSGNSLNPTSNCTHSSCFFWYPRSLADATPQIVVSGVYSPLDNEGKHEAVAKSIIERELGPSINVVCSRDGTLYG